MNTGFHCQKEWHFFVLFACGFVRKGKKNSNKKQVAALADLVVCVTIIYRNPADPTDFKLTLEIVLSWVVRTRIPLHSNYYEEIKIDMSCHIVNSFSWKTLQNFFWVLQTREVGSTTLSGCSTHLWGIFFLVYFSSGLFPAWLRPVLNRIFVCCGASYRWNVA